MEILSAIWVILACLVYGLAHSLLASLPVKAWARRRFGPAALRYYRLIYNLLGGLTFLPVLALAAILPGGRIYAIPFPWRALTLAIQGLAVVFLGIGVLQTGALSFLGLRQPFLSADALTHAETGPLVTRGLYRWVRHPLYTAGMVFLWLTPVMTWTGLGLILGLTAYVLAGAYFEERKLLVQYGAEYAAYRVRTPMFVPGLIIPRSRLHPR
jgi:methanethiol S-methyltransferase